MGRKKPKQLLSFPVVKEPFREIGTREGQQEQGAGGTSTALNGLLHHNARVAASFPSTVQGMRKTLKGPTKKKKPAY